MNTYRLPRQWTTFSVFSVAVRSKPNQLSDRRGARFHLWCPHCLSGRPEESLLLIKSKTLTQSEVILSTLSSLSPMTHKLGAEKFLNLEMASSSLSENLLYLKCKLSWSKGSSCSKAEEFMPHDRDIVCSIPAGCLAFFSFYPQLCLLNQVPWGGAALLIFLSCRLGQNKLNKHSLGS